LFSWSIVGHEILWIGCFPTVELECGDSKHSPYSNKYFRKTRQGFDVHGHNKGKGKVNGVNAVKRKKPYRTRYGNSRAIWDHTHSHTVYTCHPAEVTFPPLPQPKLVYSNSGYTVAWPGYTNFAWPLLAVSVRLVCLSNHPMSLAQKQRIVFILSLIHIDKMYCRMTNHELLYANRSKRRHMPFIIIKC